MKKINTSSLTIIIRASGESTVSSLEKQLNNQVKAEDYLHIMDELVGFEEKLKNGFDLALSINNDFSVFIDGDILLQDNALKRIREMIPLLRDGDLGFGLRLWDQFYDSPKYRGLHVYRTSLLSKALDYIPDSGETLRPESFMKKRMWKLGHPWRNDISRYVVGIHDYYQKPSDIYYKFLIRSKRSQEDITLLKSKFRDQTNNNDFKIALRGLEDGVKLDTVVNDKRLYKLENNKGTAFKNKQLNIRLFLLKKLFIRYKLTNDFWKSI